MRSPGQWRRAGRYTELQTFVLDDQRIPVVGPSGIWKPAACELPISVTTTTAGPYADTFDEGSGTLRYAYRGTDPRHRDNTASGGTRVSQHAGRIRYVLHQSHAL
jgi:hypothetical protein